MKRILCFLLTMAVMISLLAGLGITAGAEEAAPQSGLTPTQAAIEEQLAAVDRAASDKEVLNILLIGSDARSRTEAARSDVMILCSLNQTDEKIVVTSFMRDIYSAIPGHGYNRLNAAYAFGGADCLMETLEADFGVEIDYYAAVNFYDFADIVDELGGIDLELTNAEVDFINSMAYDGDQAVLGVGTGAVYLSYSADGRYHLNGTQALAYCRNRSSAGSDFDRTRRQRAAVSAMLDVVNELSFLKKASLVRSVLGMISSDLTVGKCLTLLIQGGKYMEYDMTSLCIPEDMEYSGASIDGMAVLVVDFAEASRLVQETIYG